MLSCFFPFSLDFLLLLLARTPLYHASPSAVSSAPPNCCRIIVARSRGERGATHYELVVMLMAGGKGIELPPRSPQLGSTRCRLQQYADGPADGSNIVTN